MAIPKKQTLTWMNPLTSILIALAIYIALLPIPVSSNMDKMVLPHFYVVSIVAGIAAIIAIAMGISGTRLRNPQVLFMALSFLSLTLLFGLHGLTTPGVLLEYNRIVSVAAQLSFTIMAMWLFISTLRGDNRFVKALYRYEHKLLPGLTLILGAFIVVSMLYPEIGDSLPIDREPVKWFSGGITIGLTLAASLRFWKSYLYSRYPLQFALAHAAALMAIAQVILTFSDLWTSAWWWYHGILFLIVTLPVIGLLQQYSQGDSLVLSARGIFSTDLSERLEAGISPVVRALVETSETMDAYMAGYSRRVALAALRLGAALKISPKKLRALAQGAILHDIGKLEVPENILNIKGPLNEIQYQIVQKHVEHGYEMCKQLGFLPEELSIIRHHHERLDGSGYPEGLTGENIPSLARILAVADVYDALTSDRSYRLAWTQKDAISHLLEHRGTLFDEKCVDTWVELLVADG